VSSGFEARETKLWKKEGWAFAEIDVGSERHMVAMVGEQGQVLCRSSPFGEDASGYAHLFELLVAT
jgi:hypothetical protein